MYVKKTAPRVLFENTEMAMLRQARLIIVIPVMTNDASNRFGDTPPTNCRRLRTGSPVSMKSTR